MHLAYSEWIERFVIIIIIVIHYWTQLPLFASSANMTQTDLNNKEDYWFMKPVIEE